MHGNMAFDGFTTANRWFLNGFRMFRVNLVAFDMG